MNLVTLRADLPFNMENNFLDFINGNSEYWIYSMETSKKSNKEHFHAILSTSKHIDTIRRNLRKTFKLDKSMQVYVKHVDEIIKCMAYVCKDGNYNIHWYDSQQVDEALQRITEFKKPLKDKLMEYLERLPLSDIYCPTDCTMAILKWYKENGLKYPRPWTMKDNLIKFYMDTNHPLDFRREILLKLYNVQNPFISEENI